MSIQNSVLVALLGTAAGLLGGLLGLGGAIIIIPGLVFLLGYSQQMAQGTALIMMVLPVGGLAAFQYYQNGFVDIRTALILAVFFFIGGYFGAKFATNIPQDVLRKSFAVMLLFIAVKIWLQK